MNVFDPKGIKLKRSKAGEAGSVTIIGGSDLFHGAPILSLKAASRINEMVFFSSPEPSVGSVAELLRSKLMSFIWVPWEEVGRYVEKSDAILIGPGLMRYRKEPKNERTKGLKNVRFDKTGEETKKITERLLTKFKDKKWVIDAGSLQTMDVNWIPEKAILTPNVKESEILFKKLGYTSEVSRRRHTTSEVNMLKGLTSEYMCTILLKGKEDIVCTPDKCVLVKGGNSGLTKGGTGDVLAGLVTALYAKNDAFLAASAAAYVIKKSAEELAKKVGPNFNADDISNQVPIELNKLQ